MKKKCKLCGKELERDRRPEIKYCNEFCRLLASRLRRGRISSIYAQTLIDKRNNAFNNKVGDMKEQI